MWVCAFFCFDFWLNHKKVAHPLANSWPYRTIHFRIGIIATSEIMALVMFIVRCLQVCLMFSNFDSVFFTVSAIQFVLCFMKLLFLQKKTEESDVLSSNLWMTQRCIYKEYNSKWINISDTVAISNAISKKIGDVLLIENLCVHSCIFIDFRITNHTFKWIEKLGELRVEKTDLHAHWTLS